MIDITKIRVGNIVFDNLNKRNVSVNGIETGHNTVWVDWNNGKGIYPLYVFQVDEILLTKDWFKKFGADITGDPSFMLGTPDRTLFFIINNKGISYPNIIVSSELSSLDSQCIGLNSIQYIHELQNLYFCLTGEELQLVS
jgi:hypothetical protein